MSWSTSELRVRFAPLNWFKPSSKIFLLSGPRRYFYCGSFIIFLSCVCYAFVRIRLLLPCGHLLGKGWPLGSRLWCLIVSLLLSIGILGQVWYLIVSIPDLCPLSYFNTTVAQGFKTGMVTLHSNIRLWHINTPWFTVLILWNIVNI